MPNVQEVAGGVGDPFLEANVIVPRLLGADLGLVGLLNAGLLEPLCCQLLYKDF